MSVSDYQILSVIKMYVRSMRNRVDSTDAAAQGRGENTTSKDEGMRRMIFGRIDEIVSEKIRKNGT
jgi:hypothetical protein